MAKIEESFNIDRCILGKVVPLDTPFTVLVDISDVCNFRCSYCFRHTGGKQGDYGKNKLMDWDTFVKVVEQIKAFPQQVKRISLSHNGEPLCNPLLPKMVKYIKSQGLTGSCEIHTNASLLTHNLINELVNADIDRIIVSLQGLDSEMYKEVCGYNIEFEKMYNCLEYLYQTKKDTLVNIKIIDVALEEGEEEVFYSKFSRVADKIFVEKSVPLWEKKDSEQCQYNKYGKIVEKQKCCPLLFYTMGVLPDGTIYPCSHINPPIKLGNVNTTKLQEAWNGEERYKLMRQHLVEGRMLNEKCKSCYIPQNTIMQDSDSIDVYREEVLVRLDNQHKLRG